MHKLATANALMYGATKSCGCLYKDAALLREQKKRESGLPYHSDGYWVNQQIVKDRMEDLGITTKMLAGRMNVTARTVRRLLGDPTNRFREGTVFKLADAIGVKFEKLIIHSEDD